MYKSEIRQSQMINLSDKVKKHGYCKYLNKITIAKCRAFVDETIRFDFPVTALIGPNGGGKTTILGGSALLYDSIAPRRFFTRNRQLDQDMRNWSIVYEAIDRDISNDLIRRTAHFTKEKWSRSTLKRDVLVFGISRTLPAVEQSKMSRFADRNVVFNTDEMTTLDGSAEYISKILGKDVRDYQIAQAARYGDTELLSGKTDTNTTYSEFHFGAGESNIIKMIIGIEAASENSLILIEEIENGLHPLAILRLVDYLIDVAERKKVQIIFTTHSEYAIEQLPPEAIWASVDGHVIQGKLDILSLRSLIGEVNSELVVYTEDEFAKDWVLAMMRTDSSIAIDAIDIFAMGGDGTAVKANTHHNLDPSNSIQSICLIDGDSTQTESDSEYVYRLPGEAPEVCVFHEVMDKIDECSGILAVRCMHKFQNDSEVKNVLNDIRISNYDHHLLFSQIGEKIGFVNESVVRSAFLSTWCELYPTRVAKLMSKIEGFLPRVQ